MRVYLFCMAALAAPLAAAAPDAGDAQRGAQAFRLCVACHSVSEGEHMTGPSLAHIWKRRAGTVEGFFRYSEAMKRAEIVWNEAALDKWLADPDAFLPGTAMSFPGMKQGKDRQDVIAYLKAVAENKAPAQPQRGGRGMMGMGSRRADLRSVPPGGQVVAIRHCGDTYTVETADGKSEKIWEFNLRLKTDSSRLGPPPGKPALIGAGMQGDRASIVFASPKEISAAIKQSCE